MNVGCQRTKRKLAVRYPLQTSQSAVVSAFAKCFRRGCFFELQTSCRLHQKYRESRLGLRYRAYARAVVPFVRSRRQIEIHTRCRHKRQRLCDGISHVRFERSGVQSGHVQFAVRFCYNERWLIDGKPLEDKDVARYLTIVRETIENEQNLRAAFGLDKFQPTAFEIETAVAFLAFYEKSVTFACSKRGLADGGTQPT